MYSTILPLIMVIAIVALIFNYFMEKYLLLRRYARPSLLSSILNDEMIEMFEYFPMFMCLSNIFFMYLLDAKFNYLNLLSLVISMLNFIVPSKKVNELICNITEASDS